MIGLLIPPQPWTGRLAAASAKAISLIHPDGAMISVVGRPEDMEARAMMPAEGFSGFAAGAACLLEDCGQRQSGAPKHATMPMQPGRDVFADDKQQATSLATGSTPYGCWDGNQLALVCSQVPELTSVKTQVLAFGSGIVVWDPRERLAEAAGKYLRHRAGKKASSVVDLSSRASSGLLPDSTVAIGGILAGKVHADGTLQEELRKLLAAAYAAGRRAEGLHGSGAFAHGFRRLAARPDFPAVAVGFGPGTTPAGDDWLAGYLIALDLRAGGPGKAAADLRNKIRRRLEQTTAAGRALLLGALAGSPPEYLVVLAEAAAQWLAMQTAALDAEASQPIAWLAEQKAGQVSGPGTLWDVVSNCLEHGATSGEDALAGFLYGLVADNKLLADERNAGCGPLLHFNKP